jgi:hypothetical protein
LADSSSPVNIADLGCSTGCNSLDTLETCINAIRDINPEMPINIFLEDTPANDFNITTRLVQEGLSKKNIKDIYIYCVSKSFYERLFPENSMDIIFSMTAVLWIREAPCTHDNLIFCYDSKTENDECTKKWRSSAERDWNTFLNHRKIELRSNGILCAFFPAMTEEMSESGRIIIDMQRIFVESLTEVLRNHNIEDKALDFVLPVIYRRKNDVVNYFEENPNSELKLKMYEEKSFDWVLKVKDIFDQQEINEVVQRFGNMWKSVGGEYVKSNLKKHFPKDYEKIYKLLFEEIYPEKLNLNREDIIRIKEYIYGFVLIQKFE